MNISVKRGLTLQSKKAVERTKAEFDSQNQALSEDLPKFIDGRIEYIQPCLESLIKSQVLKNVECPIGHQILILHQLTMHFLKYTIGIHIGFCGDYNFNFNCIYFYF